MAHGPNMSPTSFFLASVVAQLVKNLPAMWETWVQSLDWEDPLEKGKATHSSILTWRIPWTGLDLLAVQGTLRSLLQCHSSKASTLQYAAFFIVQL